MSVAFDANATAPTRQSAGNNLSNGNLIVGSGANRVLIATLTIASYATGVAVAWDSGGTPQSMTLIGSATNAGGYTAYLYGLVNPTSGNKICKATWTGFMSAELNCASFTGANQAGSTATFAHM